MDERIKVLQEELQQINQNIQALKAAAYDRIAELEGIMRNKDALEKSKLRADAQKAIETTKKTKK